MDNRFFVGRIGGSHDEWQIKYDYVNDSWAWPDHPRGPHHELPCPHAKWIGDERIEHRLYNGHPQPRKSIRAFVVPRVVIFPYSDDGTGDEVVMCINCFDEAREERP